MPRLLTLVAIVLSQLVATSAVAQFVKASSALKSSLRANKPVLVVVKAKLLNGPPELKEKYVLSILQKNEGTKDMAKTFTLAVADVAERRANYDKAKLKIYGSTGLSVFVPGGTKYHMNVDIDAEGKKFNEKKIIEGLMKCKKAWTGWDKKRQELFKKYSLKTTKDKALRSNAKALEELAGHYQEGGAAPESMRLYDYAIKLAQKKKDKKMMEFLALKKGDAARRGGQFAAAAKQYDWCCRAFPNSKNAPKAKIKQIENLADAELYKPALAVCEAALKDRRFDKIKGKLEEMKQSIEQRKKEG